MLFANYSLSIPPFVEYFTGAENPHHDPLMETEAKLKADPDRDVSFFATAGAHDFTPSKSQIENV